MDEHGFIIKNGNKFFIQKLNDSKILRNGISLCSQTELSHLDRLGKFFDFFFLLNCNIFLVFGTSQYYLFVDPSKASSKDPVYTFEKAQEEIGQASGLISKDNNEHLNKCKN